MDYVYLCRDGQNEELRYSIRSLEANLPNANVWVVGGKPDWYIGNHTRVFQHSHKYNNARKNLNAIFKNKFIGEDFVLMNDDFYILKPMSSIPYFHGGPLIEKIKKYENLRIKSSYTSQLKKTNQFLIQRGIEVPLDYELHVPMPMSKSSITPFVTNSCLWRSYHGNVNSVGGTQISDVKVYASNRKEKGFFDPEDYKLPFLSSEDRSFDPLVKDFLKEFFPKKSSFEA